MTTKLFKLVIDATTTTEVKTNPIVDLYFYEVDDAHRFDNTLVIPSTAFVDGEGNDVTGNLTLAESENGYYSLFINGVQQQNSLFQVEATGASLTIQQATTIPTGATIVFIVTNFDPISNSTTTITT